MATEILTHGTKVYTAPGAQFGTDALLLARFAVPKNKDRALELCSGCGIVALEWHDQGYRGACTAVEIMPEASALCAKAVQDNDAAHITPLCADLRTLFLQGAQRGQFDFAACNPPYFAAGPRSPDPLRAAARHTDSCTAEDLAACAARALRDGGKLVLCQRPDRLADVFCALRAAGMEPKRLAFARKTAQDAPWLFLTEAQKGRKPGLRIEPDLLTGNGAVRYGADHQQE